MCKPNTRLWRCFAQDACFADKKTISPIKHKHHSPTLALRDWLHAARITHDPVFRAVDKWEQVRTTGMTKKEVRLIKQPCDTAGLSPLNSAVIVCAWACLPRLLVTGSPPHAIKDITDHKSAVVLGKYIRDSGRNQKQVIQSIFGEVTEVTIDKIKNERLTSIA